MVYRLFIINVPDVVPAARHLGDRFLISGGFCFSVVVNSHSTFQRDPEWGMEGLLGCGVTLPLEMIVESAPSDSSERSSSSDAVRWGDGNSGC